MTKPKPARRHVRPREIAAESGVAPTTVYGWIESGLLPATKIGGTILVAVTDWEAFLVRGRIVSPTS